MDRRYPLTLLLPRQEAIMTFQVVLDRGMPVYNFRNQLPQLRWR